jgi:hypothetical protein
MTRPRDPGQAAPLNFRDRMKIPGPMIAQFTLTDF